MNFEFFLYLFAFGLLLITAVVIYAYILTFVFPEYRENLKSSWRSTVEFWTLKDAKKFLKEYVRGKG